MSTKKYLMKTIRQVLSMKLLEEKDITISWKEESTLYNLFS